MILTILVLDRCFFLEMGDYNQVNWNYMVRSRCQCGILQIFEENRYIFIFYVPINFKFLQDAISGTIFYIHVLPANFDYRICSLNEIFMF